MPMPMKQELQQTLKEIRDLGDQLRDKMVGASGDVKETWAKLQTRLQELEKKAEASAEKTLHEVREAAEDVKGRFKKLREEL